MFKIENIFKTLFFLFLIIIVSGCGNKNEDKNELNLNGGEVNNENKDFETKKSCEVDSDCVPASCCHATEVVNRENAPSCDNLKCTASCETVLDCGQGRPVCNDGRCGIEGNVEDNLGTEEIKEIEEIKEVKEVDVMDYCNDEFIQDPIGRDIHPIEEKYKNLSFLGEIFTASKCDKKRVDGIYGVKEEEFVLGLNVFLKNKPSKDLLKTFDELGFFCAGNINDDLCVNFVFDDKIKISELLKLEKYYGEFERVDCINCG